MLKDCLEVFKKQYQLKGEAYILDDYTLAEGNYLLIDQQGNYKESLLVAKDHADTTGEVYRLFARMDYLSRLADMNKALGIKKVIHSNNYLSFFIKKDNLTSGKLTQEVIDKYYEFLMEPEKKYSKDKKALAVYEAFVKAHGEPDKEAIERNKKWIETHIHVILEEQPEIKVDKNYLKIFFEETIKRFETESDRYFLPNIYNATEYNVMIQNQIFGMPNNNLGLNSKKPYLKHRTRKNSTPYLISTEEVMLQKKFFDFLMNKANGGFSNIYINDTDIKCLPANESVTDDFSGWFIRIQKGKELEIRDFDTIAALNNKILPCYIPESIEIDYAKVKTESQLNPRVITKLSDLKRMINNVLFSKWLSNSYFREASDIRLNDPVLKRNILASRDAFFTWFYKGNDAFIKVLFPKISRNIIKNTINNGFRLRAQEQWMLREGVINYLNREETRVSATMKDELGKIEMKINAANQQMLENDTEYAIAAGQLANFFISRNKTATPKHALINPVLNVKTDNELKEMFKRLFKKYNYDIECRSRRFNNLYAMILAYEAAEIDEDALLYGYLTNSLIYKKGGETNE